MPIPQDTPGLLNAAMTTKRCFHGGGFQELLLSYGIESTPTTVKNPTAQSLVERLHLTMGDQLRATVYSADGWQDDMNTISKPLLGHFVLLCHQILHTVQVKLHMEWIWSWDWNAASTGYFWKRSADNKELLIMKRRTRIVWSTKIFGVLVLIVDKPYKRTKKEKLSSPTEGTYEVLQVYTNGNVHIWRGNHSRNGWTTSTWKCTKSQVPYYMGEHIMCSSNTYF